MASKSKRRRRVFRASCILAALIIAGSSFAWFTSKDEVTNRLSASADYDVSIIENFAPPKQWVPGQTVKKEEAVTNTGNIDAFVKQQITGDLEVTVEIPASTPPTANSGYITLKPAEYGAIEAGSYLAWKPVADTTNKIGKQVVYAINNSDDNDKNDVTDFTPVAEGLYIFRRAVTTEKKVDGTNSTLEDTAYEYVGYYYKDGVYYKLNRIDKNSLEAGTDGNLTSAPTVMYAKEESEAIKKVPMAYYDDNNDPRLVVNYQTNRSSDLSTMAQLDKAAYQAYDNYLDKLTGKTSWDEDANSSYTTESTYGEEVTKAADTANKTGLTDYDQYFDASTNADPVKDDLTNWSLERLEKRASETQNDLNAASPNGADTEANWKTVYDAAVADRATVNKGVRSAERLAKLMEELRGIVGTTNNGITQKAVYDFHYSSTLYEEKSDGTIEVKAPVVALDNPVTDLTGNSTNGDGIRYLTLDTMNDDSANDETHNNDGEGKFNDKWINTGADSANGNTTAATSDARYKDVSTNFGVKFDYAHATTTGTINLKGAWDEYVKQTKRQKLVDAKIDLVERAIEAATTSNTDVGRSVEELQEMLTALQSEKRAIDKDFNDAKTAYENLVLGTATTKGVKDYIDQLNAYQDDINAANEVDTGKTYPTTTGFSTHINVYKGDQSATNADNYPAADATTGFRSTVFNSGESDTLTEATLKQYLINVYGIALKESGTKDYVGTTDASPVSAWPGTTGESADLYKDIYTYSQKLTKDTVDANLENTKDGNDDETGVIGWKTTPTGGFAPITATGANPGDAGRRTDVEGAPYYADRKVDMMKDFRQDEVDDLLDAYNAAKKAAVIIQDSDENLDPITIIVHLDNIDNTPNDRDKWQYIANATDANEYNFFYTSVLGSGKTSTLLIKSVEMSEGVTQDMFRDLQFDLNVVAESAQAQYEDGLAMPTAANASLSGGQTTKDTGYAENEMVAWKKRTEATTNTITSEDPDGKAATDVDGTTYTKSGKLGDADAADYTIEKVPATTVSGNSYIYKITVGGTDVYYGNSVETGAEFKQVTDPAAESLAFNDTADKIVIQ